MKLQMLQSARDVEAVVFVMKPSGQASQNMPGSELFLKNPTAHSVHCPIPVKSSSPAGQKTKNHTIKKDNKIRNLGKTQDFQRNIVKWLLTLAIGLHGGAGASCSL